MTGICLKGQNFRSGCLGSCIKTHLSRLSLIIKPLNCNTDVDRQMFHSTQSHLPDIAAFEVDSVALFREGYGGDRPPVLLGLKMGFSGRIGWFFTAFGLQTPHSGPNPPPSESRSDDRGNSCAAAEGEPSPSPLEVQGDSGTFFCRFLSQRHPKAPRRDNFCHFLSTRAAATQ